MKSRHGFVSNSSSSSFLIVLQETTGHLTVDYLETLFPKQHEFCERLKETLNSRGNTLYLSEQYRDVKNGVQLLEENKELIACILGSNSHDYYDADDMSLREFRTHLKEAEHLIKKYPNQYIHSVSYGNDGGDWYGDRVDMESFRIWKLAESKTYVDCASHH